MTGILSFVNPTCSILNKVIVNLIGELWLAVSWNSRKKSRENHRMFENTLFLRVIRLVEILKRPL